MTSNSRQIQFSTRCGHVVSVALSQAGQAVRCPNCQATVELPTYRDLKQLAAEQNAAAATTRSPQRAWTPAQGYLFVVGLCLIAVSIFAATQVFQRLNVLQTEPPSVEDVMQDVANQEVPASQLWDFWVQVREMSLVDRDQPFFLQQRELAAGYRRWLALLAALAISGVAMIAGSLWPRVTPGAT
ncbi:MAG: hypothetical protein U0795_14095 [Pirellulales bacterium]